MFLRIRPAWSEFTYIESLQASSSIRIQKDYEMKEYLFDSILTPKDSQMKVFKKVMIPILESFVKGVNGSLITYGQTGSGKTLTVLGNEGIESQNQGMLQLSLSYILSQIPSHLQLYFQAV